MRYWLPSPPAFMYEYEFRRDETSAFPPFIILSLARINRIAADFI